LKLGEEQLVTEGEWVACDDARLMVTFVRTRLSDRKARLLACVAAAMVLPVVGTRNRRKLRAAIAAAEAFADGTDVTGEMERLRPQCWAVTTPDARQCAVETCRDPGIRQRQAELAVALRCITGNPFRPVHFSPEWRTTTAVSLARTMYDAHDFSAMPILADALQDAGCDNDDILSHCRDATATHVRGCWVVDLVLDKE
jgi:hypothetical protein